MIGNLKHILHFLLLRANRLVKVTSKGHFFRKASLAKGIHEMAHKIKSGLHLYEAECQAEINPIISSDAMATLNTTASAFERGGGRMGEDAVILLDDRVSVIDTRLWLDT